MLLLLWLLALLAVLLLPLGFPAWQDASLFRPSLLEAPKQLNLLELFIPVNPFEAFATTQIPAVVLFSLCLGIALIGVPARQNLISILDRLSDGLLAISAFVARFTPIGVFTSSPAPPPRCLQRRFRALASISSCRAASCCCSPWWCCPS